MAVRSLRLYQSRHTYRISAQLSLDGALGRRNDPILYVETSCPAVADYCLLGRHSETIDTDASLKTDLNSAEHLEACLRMRRCGAVSLVPVGPDWEGRCRISLATHVRKARYLFGWPPVDSLSTNGRPVEHVWVYYISQPAGLPLNEEAIRFGGMEEYLGCDWLRECSTMNEYCERLRICGAVYYENVQDSPEAREMGLVARAGTVGEVIRQSNEVQSGHRIGASMSVGQSVGENDSEVQSARPYRPVESTLILRILLDMLSVIGVWLVLLLAASMLLRAFGDV
jgi:hypothetical protein